MTNNDILRRLRHALDLSQARVSEIISGTGVESSFATVSAFLRREEEHGFVELSDTMLCRFLDGLIIEKRGGRRDGTVPEPLTQLSNNEILKKLRIALELRDDGMNAVFEEADFAVTKAELSSFFRTEGHRNFRPCPEQVLRKFIQGLGKKSLPGDETET